MISADRITALGPLFGLALLAGGCYRQPGDITFGIDRMCKASPNSRVAERLVLVEGQKIELGGVSLEVVPPGRLKYADIELPSGEIYVRGLTMSDHGRVFKVGFNPAAEQDKKFTVNISYNCMDPLNP